MTIKMLWDDPPTRLAALGRQADHEALHAAARDAERRWNPRHQVSRWS